MAADDFAEVRVPYSETPGGSGLCLDYVERKPGVQSFYGHSYDIDSIAAFSRGCPRPSVGALGQLCDALRAQQEKWGSSNRGVDKLRAGAVAVITGQQPGLFSGPLYAVFKAITAIKLARALDERGIPAAPVFWIAAEDHDQQEIRWASVLDRDGAPRRFQIDLEGDPAAPVGWTRYAGSVGETMARLWECLPDSEFIPEIRTMLEAAYAPGASPVDAFARLFARLFSSFDLTLVDPLDPPLKRLAGPILERAARSAEEIRSALRRQNQAIADAGYHEQVRVGDDFTGLFVYEDGARRPLKPNQSVSGLTLSPNVLVRPVVQDYLFPTAAYVGGPAEIAYFAQAAAIYRVLERPMPPIYPRIGATLVEARVARALDAYGLDAADAWRGRDFLAKKAGRRLEGAPLFDHLHDVVNAELEALRPLLASVDPTLSGAIDTSRQKMLHQVEGLRTRYLNAQTKQNQVMDRRLDAIVNALYPEKKLQERELNIVSFISRYGMGLLDRLEKRLGLDVRGHQFAGIE